MGLNVGKALPALLRGGGDTLMYVTLEREWTYRQVYERMNQLMHALIDLGIKMEYFEQKIWSYSTLNKWTSPAKQYS